MMNDVVGIGPNILNVRLCCLNSFENLNANEYKMIIQFIKLNGSGYEDFATIISALEEKKGVRASNLLTALRGTYKCETLGEYIITYTDYKFAVINPSEKVIYTLLTDKNEVEEIIDQVISPSIICSLKFENGKLSGKPYKNTQKPPTEKQLNLIKQLGLTTTFRGKTAQEAYKFIEDALKNQQPKKEDTTLPATEKQLKLIDSIHKKTGARFTGKTVADATKFIDANWLDFTRK